MTLHTLGDREQRKQLWSFLYQVTFAAGVLIQLISDLKLNNVAFACFGLSFFFLGLEVTEKDWSVRAKVCAILALIVGAAIVFYAAIAASR